MFGVTICLCQQLSEEIDRHAERLAGEFGVVAEAFIAEEGVSCIHLVLSEVHASGSEGFLDEFTIFG